MRIHALLAALSVTGLLALHACSSEVTGSPSPDASALEDAFVPPPPPGVPGLDAQAADARGPDGGADTSGADTSGSGDSGPYGDILGTHSGSCGEVRAELGRAAPSLKIGALAFAPGETYDKSSLSPGGQRIFDTPNAGGSSTESEVMSFEVLRYCEGASLLKTETEVVYGPAPDGGANAITDILVEIDGKAVGVSVTRAYKPVNQGAQTDAEVKTLLERKLQGINASTARVSPGDRWVKQVLHVLAATQASVDAISRVLPTIDAATQADTVVLVTRTTGGGFIYCNPDPPLGQECP